MSKTIQIELPEGVSEQDVKIEFVAKPKPKLWVPNDAAEYYFIDSDDKPVVTCFSQRRRVDNYNAYPTKPLARKAADYLAPYRMLVRTALEVDPEFEPDWYDASQKKFCLYKIEGNWAIDSFLSLDYHAPVVSTEKKAEQWLELVKAEEAER